MAYSEDINFQDRREYFRINFKTPIEFRSYATPSNAGPAKLAKGSSQNISQTGILFKTSDMPPKLSSIVWMNLDIRTLSICQEIEKKALILNKGLVGKVVRVEEDMQDTSAYDIGVCFLTQDQKDSREVRQILSEISQTQ